MRFGHRLRRFIRSDGGLRTAAVLLYFLVAVGGLATLVNLKSFRDWMLAGSHQRISGVAAALAQHLPHPLDVDAEIARLAPLYAGLGESAVVAIIDRDHGLLLSLPPSTTAAQVPPSALERLDGSGGQFVGPWPEDGIDRLWSYVPVADGRPLAVLVGLPQSTVTAAVTQLAWHLTGLIAAMAGGAALLAYLLHQLRIRDRIEAELIEKSCAAVVASEAKTAFLANMSHELRTPLTGVLGMAELMGGTRLDREQTEMLATISTSAQTLLTVLNDVLDYSRMDAGDLKLEVTDVDLPRLAGDTMRLLRPAAVGKNLRLEEDVAPDCPRWVHGDPARLQQVLFNLIGNAIKFTEHGGVTLRLWPEGERIVFAVEDTGIGMDAPTLARLFTPFTQADGSNTRRHGGTGLGLAIAKRLVALMGGTLAASSAPDRGSLFQFSLLLPPGRAPAMPDTPQSLAAARSLCVLLAEDNPVNQTLLLQLLKRMGHSVTLAQNGAEALEMVSAQAFDVVLMDMQMPVMDGETATKLIRMLPGERAHLPVVALTADAEPEHHDRYVAAGLNAYLIKPVPAELLARTLEEVTTAPTETEADPACPPVQSPQPSASATPILDPAYVEDMRQWVGDTTLLTLLATAPDSFSSELAAIRAAWHDGNIQGVRENAHRLKGAAGSVGCRRLSEIAQLVQKATADEMTTTDLLQQLETEVAAAMAAATQWRPGEPAVQQHGDRVESGA